MVERREIWKNNLCYDRKRDRVANYTNSVARRVLSSSIPTRMYYI